MASARSGGSANKRRATDEGGGDMADSDGENDEVSPALAALLRSTKEEILTETGKLLDSQLLGTAAKLEKHFEQQQAVVNKKIDNNTQAIEHLNHGHHRLETQQAEIWKSVRALQDVLDVKQSAFRPDGPTAAGQEVRNWHNFDATIMRANTGNLVEFTKLEDTIKSLCEEAQVPRSQWALKGAKVGDNFTVQFGGTPDIASLYVKKVIGVLKAPSDSCETVKGWRQIYVSRPSGPKEKLYLSKDKSLANRLLDLHCKRLIEALNEVHGEAEFEKIFHRRTRYIAHKCDKLVSVEFDEARKTSRLAWTVENSTELAINKDRIEAIFKEKIAQAERARG